MLSVNLIIEIFYIARQSLIDKKYHKYNNTVMKKTTIATLSVLIAFNANAAQNIMFAPNAENSVTLYVGQSSGKGTLFKIVDPFLWEINPQTFIMVQYSQPMEIFRLQSRINLNALQNVGYQSSADLSFAGVGISWDITLLNWGNFYSGLGAGPYYRSQFDRWVASRLVFGEKFFFGTKINDSWRAEFFALHFSNGDFTKPNYGFNFFGLGLNYSF